MANPIDEYEIPKAGGHPMASAKNSLATSTDPNNAARLAKVPPGIGGNPIAQTAASAPPAAPAMKPNSFGDAAAAANTPGVTQIGVTKPGTSTALTSSPAVQPAMLQTPPVAAKVDQPASVPTQTATAEPPKSQQIANSMLMGPVSTQKEAAQQGQLWRQSQAAESNERYDAAGAQMAAEARDAAVMRMSRAHTRPLSAPAIAPSTGVAALDAYDKANPLVATASQPGLASGQQTLPSGVVASSAGGGRGSINPALADPTKPPPSLAENTLPSVNPMTNLDRTGMTNAQVAQANPGGRVTMTRQANGTMAFSGGDVSGPVSYMDGGGNPLVGAGIRGNGFSGGGSAPAGSNVGMGPNGSYAFASGNPLVNSASGSGQQTGAAAAAGMAPGQSPGATASPVASDSVNTALAAAAQRGDFEAVRAHYAGRGQGGVQGASDAQPGFSGSIGQSSGNGNAWSRTPEQQRRDAETQASSIHRQTAANGAAALKNLDAQEISTARNQTDLTREHMRQSGDLSRESMRQTGENFRSVDRNRLVAADQSLRASEANSRNQLTNLEVARGQRTADILKRYDNAKDDAERQTLVKQYPDAFGMKAGDQSDWRVQVTPATKNADGSTTAGSIVRYNQRTGQVEPIDVGGGQASNPRELADPKARPVGTVSTVNGKSATWDGAKWVPRA